MFDRHRPLIIVLRTCIAATCLFRSANAQEKPAEKPLRLIFIAPVIHEDFFLPVQKGMRDAAKVMGVSATFTGTEGIDTKAQAAMIARAVKDGYDGIAVDIIDTADFDKPIAEAIAAGVPVVAFNTDDTTQNARLSTVSQNLYRARSAPAIVVAPSRKQRHLPVVTWGTYKRSPAASSRNSPSQ